ncbi:hypothetical protein LTR37_008500 [Vermiconidia calcicola]|uniref:Uncharacterized protein n=1 Tax=Vermiconidia calcicola TaxID=1690605 RepID=A0ACC3NB91_9PEZI|nr:hypothetical protein LTR37_008500 [Vermiconidia calcicola]
MLTAEEVRKHDSRRSCWVVISGEVYDVTEFLNQHPGGPASILRCAGRDATEEYEPVHPPGTIETHLDKGTIEKHLGPIDVTTLDALKAADVVAQTSRDSEELAPLPTLQNLDDFESEARKIVSKKAWVYFSSSADSTTAHARNRLDWTRVNFRPRILRNVGKPVSMRRRIMGHDSSLPFFIAPAAQARLGHPEGELCLARGAARYNIPYCSSTYSSIAHKDLAKCLAEERKGGALLWQLYVPIATENAKSLIAEAKKLGFKALVITVDSAVIGRREEDDRYKAELDHAAGIELARSANPAGAAPILRGAHSSTLNWDDLTWIRQAWNDTGPVILKGIQTAEDALLAAEAGVDGIYLSNHGGRQLDYAPSSLQTLLEIRKFYPHLLETLEIYLDGGVMRGTDILKAICLGATAVALGRPFMYALTGYGTAGVCKAIEILSDQMETSMRLMGVTELSQLTEFYVNTAILEQELPRRIDQRDGNAGKVSSKL